MARDYKIPVLFEGDPATTQNPTEHYFSVLQREDDPGELPNFEIPSLETFTPEVIYALADDAYVYRTQTADSKSDVFNPLLALNRPLERARDGHKKIRIYAELGGGGQTGGADDGAGPADKANNPLWPNWTLLAEFPVWTLMDFYPALINDTSNTGHAGRYAQSVVGRWAGVYNRYLPITKNVIGDIKVMAARPANATLFAAETTTSIRIRLNETDGSTEIPLARNIFLPGQYFIVAKNADNSGKGSAAYEIMQVPETAGYASSGRDLNNVRRARFDTTATAFVKGDLVGFYFPDQITHLALGSADEDTRPISKLEVHLSI